MLRRVSRDQRRTVLLLPIAAALVAAAGILAGDAAGEMPTNRDAPTVTGALLVGATLTGHNGSWLYSDGSSCRTECEYFFAWQRCVPGGGCTAIPGADSRAYVVSAADVGRSLRVVVTARKYDCNAQNQDCRHVLVSAVSSLTEVVPAPPPPPLRLAIDQLSAAAAPGGRVAVALRVTDGTGHGVRGARVSLSPVVRGTLAAPRPVLTGRNGAAGFLLERRARARAGWFSVRIRAEQPARLDVIPATLLVRVRLAAAR
jgi:hypothetical protein